jgi:hypothetical protein
VERIRSPWDWATYHQAGGRRSRRRAFGAIAVFAFVRILLFLAAVARARRLTAQGTATDMANGLTERSRSREITQH